MKQSKSNTMAIGAAAQRKAGVRADRSLSSHYHIEARDPQGSLKWTDDFDNLVTNEGLDDSLTQHLKGSNYSAAWYVGLLSATPTFIAGNTMGTHAGWTEVVAYDEAVRQTLTLGAVSGQSVSNTASPAVFTISTNGTDIGGAFVALHSAKAADSGYNTGVLYGGGAFTAGNKSLDDGDTLTVTITMTAAAA